MKNNELHTFCVYRHTSPHGKVYIGITGKNPLVRWNNGKGYSHNKRFFNAILKYGWDNFKHEILFAYLSREEAEQKEIELIAKYESQHPDKGYNIASGGHCGGHPHTAESKQKIALSHIGTRNPMCGREPPNKGKPRTAEEKSKMIEARKDKKAVVQYSQTTDAVIAVHQSARDAERKTGIDHSSIIRCCKGKRKTSGGFVWRYEV